MDEQMFCFQCEQAAGCTACTGAAGVCGKSAETAAAQDRLTGALIAFAGQLIAAGRGPTPEQARLLMQGLFTTITNVNFDPAAVDALTRRVHDAYSAIRIALALADAFGCGVNDLPLSLVLCWFEQKAVCILIALLALGIRNIRLGPTLPPFLSPVVVAALQQKYDLKAVTTPENDLQAILGRH